MILFQALSSVFCDWDSRGFLVQSYKTETYLQPLLSLAREQREAAARRLGCDPELVRLSRLERNLCHALGVAISSLEHEGDLDMETLEQKLVRATATKKDIIKQSFQQAKQRYQSVEDQRRFVAFKFYDENVKAQFLEIDQLIVLDKEKLVINVETKSIDQNRLKNTLKHAADQQKIRKKVFMNCHKDILDSSWRFVSVIALPFVENKEDKMINENIWDLVCDTCKPFILDYKEKLDVRDWIEKVLDCHKAEATSDPAAQRSYILLYNRIIGFMSVSTKFGLATNVFMSSASARGLFERSILGAEKGISSELEGSKEIIKAKVSESILKEKQLSSLQLLFFWNEEQLQFLVMEKKKVLFLADFGVGKTLMKKHMAFKTAKSSLKKVYYISLASTMRDESDLKNRQFHVCRSPSVFDVANSLDFENHKNIEFLSIVDLIQRMHDDCDDVANEALVPSDLLKSFMQNHEDCHFFIDEFPLAFERCESDETFLEYLKERTSLSDNFLWITLRLCETHEKLYDEFMKNVNFYKEWVDFYLLAYCSIHFHALMLCYDLSN